MVQNATLPIGTGSASSASESIAPMSHESHLDVAELVDHFTNVHISNNTLDDDSAPVPSESSTNPDQATPADLDAAPPPSPTSVASLPTSESDSKDGPLFNAIPTLPPLNLPDPGVAVLTGPPHPSVLVPPPPHPAPQDWYRLYRGYYYCVPPPTAVPPFYMVTKGLCVGIFSGWEIVGPLTIKVSGSIQRRIPSAAGGVDLFEKALEDGKVEILRGN